MAELREWLGLLALIISVSGAAYAWITARSKVNAEHLKRVDESLKAHDRRIQTLESELEHRPSKDSHHQLELTMRELQGDVKLMAANIESVTRTTRRMEEFLMGEK